MYIRNDFRTVDFAFEGKKIEKNILKNANNMAAKIMVLKGYKYSLVNTCAFDSFAQVILKSMRSEKMKSAVQQWKSEFGLFMQKLTTVGKH